VRTIRRQSWLIIISFVIAAVAVVGVVYKAIQRPDRIVVDMSSGRTVMINDRELGATEAVCLEKDKLQIADMDYVVKAYLEYLYGVDQTSRSKDIEAAKVDGTRPGQEIRAIPYRSRNPSDPTRTAMDRH
jgi:hypothetical protein